MSLHNFPLMLISFSDYERPKIEKIESQKELDKNLKQDSLVQYEIVTAAYSIKGSRLSGGLWHTVTIEDANFEWFDQEAHFVTNCPKGIKQRNLYDKNTMYLIHERYTI